MNNWKASNVLYDKTKIHINYGKSEIKGSQLQLVNDLIDFSKENNVDIEKYEFIDESELNIYSTNYMDNMNAHLLSGEFPKNENYITNKDKPSNKSQSGLFSFPVSSLKIKIYEFKQIANVGVGLEFYLDFDNSDLIHAFVQEFTKYGEISVIDTVDEGFPVINKPILYTTILSATVFGILMFLYLVRNRRSLLLKELWGFDTKKIVYNTLRVFLKFTIILEMVMLFFWMLFMYYNLQGYFGMQYLIIFLLSNGTVIALGFSFTALETMLILKLNKSTQRSKETRTLRKLQTMSGVLKVILTFLMFFSLGSTLLGAHNLNQKVTGFSAWNTAKNIFRIEYTQLDERVNLQIKLEKYTLFMR